MNVHIKRIDKDLPLPEYKTPGAVAFDLYSRLDVIIPARQIGKIPANVIVKTPSGFMLYLKDRSSTALKKGLIITAGIVDQDYCGDSDELILQFLNFTENEVLIKRGERIAQGIFISVSTATWQEVDTMESPNRGGFGTTG
jgi:dUTP pyrophosphatase